MTWGVLFLADMSCYSSALFTHLINISVRVLWFSSKCMRFVAFRLFIVANDFESIFLSFHVLRPPEFMLNDAQILSESSTFGMFEPQGRSFLCTPLILRQLSWHVRNPSMIQVDKRLWNRGMNIDDHNLASGYMPALCASAWYTAVYVRWKWAFKLQAFEMANRRPKQMLPGWLCIPWSLDLPPWKLTWQW